MKKQIEQLKEFHTAFNLPQRDAPTMLPVDEFLCRHNLLIEEVNELKDAHCDKYDIVEVADAITDCMYVLICTALQYGLTDVLEKCFDEVHRSNMSKLENGKPLVKNGKAIKGKFYQKPDLARILNKEEK